MDQNIEIIDNFLTEEENYQLYSSFLNINFPWYIEKVIYDEQKKFKVMCSDEDNYQFSHYLYKNYQPYSNYFGLLNYFLIKLKIGAIFRAKVNLNQRTTKIINHSYHIDTTLKCKTLVYYINHNNGYTKFENGSIVESFANRALIFPSNLMHTGTTCTDNNCRLVLNINYFD